jgi:diaminopimelate epimerase
MRPRVLIEGRRVTGVEVDMGRPLFLKRDIPMAGVPDEPALHETLEIDGNLLEAACLFMGNPHCVLFLDDLETISLPKLGKAIENHPAFPRRTNVEFARVLSPRLAEVRVWERGAGETLACGTGACAVAAAGHKLGKLEREVTIRLPGGELLIELQDDGHVMMTGPAEEVFEGEFICTDAY